MKKIFHLKMLHYAINLLKNKFHWCIIPPQLCGGRMDLASLRSYYEQINLYESILATEPNTKGEQYADDTFTYYRVQGGSSSRSKYLLVVNPDGTMQVNNTGNLSLSAYTTDHMHYFSKKRGENTEVVSFEVPRWFDDFVRETAIPQEKYTMNLLNQGRSAPKMTDLKKPGFTYEFPPIWNEWLAEYAFNAKVVKGGLP